MAWRHRIALVLLLALTGLPLGGTLCAMLCDSTSTQGMAHHGTNEACERPSAAPSEARISGAAGHDCGAHDASMRLVAATAVARADLNAKVAPALVDSTRLGKLEPPPSGEDAFDRFAPPGTAPPTARPVVLRV